MTTKRTGLIVLLSTAALALAACTSGSGGGSGPASESGSSSSTATPQTGSASSIRASSGTATGSGGNDSSTVQTSSSTSPPQPGEVGGSACGTPHGRYDDPATPSGTVTIAASKLATSLNAGTGHGHQTRNLNPQYLLDGPGLFYYNDENELVNNDLLGTCTLDSLDPLTVTYTINSDVTWSDGVPVTAADIVLDWAAGSGLFTVPAGDDGTGAATSFDSHNPGAELITSFPTISDDGHSVTFTYSHYFSDYDIALGIGVPAHVVAMHAWDGDDAARATKDMMTLFAATAGSVAAATAQQRSKLAAIERFWNTGFDTTSLPKDSSLAVSYGAYQLVGWEKGHDMVFRARSDYDWGPKPAIKTLRLVHTADAAAAVKALSTGDIDIAAPTATADVISALHDASGDISSETGASAAYEHLDLVFDNGGPFDPASYGGDAETALTVRKAFLLTVPRAPIVHDVIQPLNPKATVRQAFTRFPGEPGYQEMVADNGSGYYAKAGSSAAIAKAQKMLADAGVTAPVKVRLLYAADKPRRAKVFQLIEHAAAKAGFTVINGKNAGWADLLGDNSLYDAVLFAWQPESTGVSELVPNYRCKAGGEAWGANNYGHFCDRKVNAALADLTSEPGAQQRMAAQRIVEKALWSDGFGLPLYQLPSVVAYHAAGVTGVGTQMLPPTFLWNFWQWKPGDQS